MSLSIGDIARRIEPDADRRDSMARRLRHLTATHCLHPITARHAGTGRHRQYDSEAVYEAALMVRLLMMGLPVSVLTGVAAWLQALRVPMKSKAPAKTKQTWKAAIDGADDVWLAFSPKFTNGNLDTMDVVIRAGLQADQLTRDPAHIVVNLSQLFGGIKV